MPNGYGAQHLGRAATQAAASFEKPRSARSDDLAQAAILAVPKLAAAAGHPIANRSGSAGGDGANPLLTAALLALAAAAAAAVIVKARARRAQRTH